MLPVLIFPQFDPVMVHIGPFAIRWYAMAYITALLFGWWLVRRLVKWTPKVADQEQVDDFLTWATIGVILGGRLGYVLFYQPEYYLSHPLDILKVWQGGMSFHGGALGVILALILFTWRNKLSFLGFSDRVTVVVPVGLGLGRLANFINGELWGREVSQNWLHWVPWAMIFPDAGMNPRHPSQIYECILEGIILFLIMIILANRQSIRERKGFLSGVFLLGYAIMRSIAECFRQPDAFIGFLPFGTTMGQLLCIPMATAGICFIWYACHTYRSTNLVSKQ